jgi:hypothetical protein
LQRGFEQVRDVFVLLSGYEARRAAEIGGVSACVEKN